MKNLMIPEDVIMDVINAVEYKQDDWNPWDYHRGLCGIGYSGMKMNPEMRHSVSYHCSDLNVHPIVRKQQRNVPYLVVKGKHCYTRSMIVPM